MEPINSGTPVVKGLTFVDESLASTKTCADTKFMCSGTMVLSSLTRENERHGKLHIVPKSDNLFGTQITFLCYKIQIDLKLKARIECPNV